MDDNEALGVGEVPRQRTSAALLALGEGADARTLALLTEAARIADRLDELDEGISNGGLLRLVEDMDESDDEHREVHVYLNKPLAEARQQAVALRAILTTLGVDKLEAKAKGVGILDQLAAARAKREAAAAGRVATAVDV